MFLFIDRCRPKTTHQEVAKEEKARDESWSREQTSNDRRINNDCVREGAIVKYLLFLLSEEPGTELSMILMMYLERRTLLKG